MGKLDIKKEVETVLGRELIGHERAIVAHAISKGMVNPADIAMTMLDRHLANVETRIELEEKNRLAILAEMTRVINFQKGA